MNNYKAQSFLKLTLRFSIIFLIVITLIKIVISIFNNGGVDGMIQEYFSPDTWERFAIAQSVMSLFYGLFMAGYYKFIKK